jgi:hypothetical protein
MFCDFLHHSFSFTQKAVVFCEILKNKHTKAMLHGVKVLIFIYLLQHEVSASSIRPKSFNERLKTRRIFQTLDSRFGNEDFKIDEPKPAKVPISGKSGVIPEVLESRFSFDGETNANEKSDDSMEYGEYFQGDLELMPEQDKVFKSKDESDILDTRTGQLNEYYRWPKNSQGYVIVPYHIYEESGYCELVVECCWNCFE